jgi:hypothetical protein
MAENVNIFNINGRRVGTGSALLRIENDTITIETNNFPLTVGETYLIKNEGLEKKIWIAGERVTTQRGKKHLYQIQFVREKRSFFTRLLNRLHK